MSTDHLESAQMKLGNALIACADGFCPTIADRKCPSSADRIVHSISRVSCLIKIVTPGYKVGYAAKFNGG